MFRDRALRVALVLVGLMFLSGVLGLLQYNNPSKAWEQMLASVYVTLGVFLIIAAFNPLAHRSLIAFTGWSSLVHGAVMGVQAVKGVIPHSDLLQAATPMLAIGVVFLLLAPPRPTASGTG
jgi:FtsH-binding integral membrane protein